MKLLVTLAFFGVATVLSLPHREVQSVAVKGKLICDGKPAADIKLKLYDSDTFTLDDLMGEGKTDDDGTLFVSGHTKEWSKIDPKLNVYHRCGDTGGITQKCAKKFSIKIPKDYITRGNETPARTFDIGTLNLNAGFSGESRDCIH